MRRQRTAEDERVQPRGPRRTPPAAPPLSRRAVRRSASCAPTAAASASSCDTRYRTKRASPRTRRGPASHRLAPRPDRRRHHRHVRLQRRGAVRRKARRAGAVAGRPPHRDPVVDLAAPPTGRTRSSTCSSARRSGRGSRPAPGCARPTGRPAAGRPSSRPRPSSSASRRRATAPQRQHAAVALAVQLELGVGEQAAARRHRAEQDAAVRAAPSGPPPAASPGRQGSG